MREAKRILLAPRLWGLLALLIAVDLMLLITQDGHSAEFYTAYQETLSEYTELSPEEGIVRADAERRQIQNLELLYAWSVEENAELRDWLWEDCAEAFGVDFEVHISDGSFDLSQEAMTQVWLRREVLQAILPQLEYLRDYPDYLARVQANAKQMSALPIFSKEDSFSLRNIEKTGKDFPHEVATRLGNDFAVNTLFSDGISGWSLLVFTLFLVLQCAEERKQGLWCLIHGAPKGRGKLALRRVLILLIGVVLGTLILLGERLIFCAIRCGGLGDLTRNVQSAAIFRNFPWVLPIWMVILCFFLLKALGMWLVALTVFAVLQAVNHLPLALGTAGIVLAGEYTLFRFIPDSYTIVILRYVNLFAFVDVPSVALRYLNLNFFGWPVQGFLLSIALVPPMLGSLALANFLLAEKKKPVSRQNPVLSVFDRLRVPFSRTVGKFKLLGMELHKLLWQQKGLLILAALAVFSFGYLETPYTDIDLYDTELAGVSASFQGPITEETLRRIDEMIDECAKWEPSEGTLQRQIALSRLRAKVADSLDARDGQWLINQAPLAALMGKNINHYQRGNAAVLILVLVLMLSGIFAQEQQSKTGPLLRGTPFGRGKLWGKKLTAAFLLTVLVWAVFEIAELQKIAELYGPFPISAPIQSFDAFSDFSCSVPLGFSIAAYLFLRLFGLCFAAGAICLLSSFCSRVNTALLLCTAVLVLPACLCWMDISIMESLSVTVLLSPTEVNVHTYGIGAILTIILCWLSRRRWMRAAL